LIDKKIYIYFLLILLVSLSGCLEFITTREKQACLALTHYSSTSIDDCTSQNKCFTEIEKLSIEKNNKIPLSLSQNIDTYKNYLASSHYYYTLTKKELDLLNEGCRKENIKTILDNYNDVMDLFSKTFSYVDNATKKSMYLIIDYTLFLEQQEVNLIPEEEIFQDYILLNDNINFMKKQIENESYLSKVNQEIKELHVYSKELGFRETYLAKENVSDLTLYYLQIYEKEINSQEINLPEILRINNFVYKKLSNIEDLRNINYNLDKLDGYNFYILMDKLVGKEKSLVTEFIIINNRITENLDVIYNKIEDYQKEIEKNKEYLTTEKYNYYLKQKNYFENKTITFGKYLSELKEINLEILQNQEIVEKEKLENSQLFACDILVENLEEQSNLYISRLISQYKESDNLLEKLNYCEKIKNANEIQNCQELIYSVIESEIEEVKDYELYIYSTEEDCLEHINNINYKLESNEKIIIIKKRIKEIENKINEIYVENKLEENYEIISEIEKDVKEIKQKNNVELIININENQEKINNIEREIDLIIKKIIQENKNYTIKKIDDKYYFELINNFSEIILNIEIENNYLNLVSKDPGLLINKTQIKIHTIYPGKNYFLVDYENNKNINYEIIYLSLKESIIKITIENEVEGIYDSLLFIDGFISKNEDVIIEENNIYYYTKKENEFYVYGPVFENNLSKNIEEISSDKFITTTNISLKNKFFEKINQKLIIKETKENEINNFYKNNKEITLFEENGNLIYNIEIKKDEVLEFVLKTLIEKNKVYEEIREIILAAEELRNTRFLDIQKESIKELKYLLDKPYSEEYSINEIETIYSYYNTLQKLLEKNKHYQIIEENYLITLNEIYQKELTSFEENKLEKIESNKYQNMVLAEKDLIQLLIDIKKREKDLQNDTKSLEIAEFKELNEIINENNLENIDLDLLSKDKNITEIKDIINQKLKEKAEELYYYINPITNNLEEDKINEIITKTYLLYETYTLTDLYSIGYFSGITENDAKRLEKNYAFLESVLFNKELSNFDEKYNEKDYKGALNAISLETINRIEKIKSDYDNLTSGLIEIKDDAKKEIIDYQKKEYDVETLNFAKTNYDDEKYLDVIYVLKQTNPVSKNSTKTQYILITIIVVLFVSLYAYLRLGNKKKEKTIAEKKKKILRH